MESAAGSEDEVAKTDFTLLVDRPVPAEVVLAAWCPCMDLVALATADGQLAVHRLNWQRLWSISPETINGLGTNFVGGTLISALAWSPDGKQLAVGGVDGGVALVCAEDGHITIQGPSFEDGIVHLSWVEADESFAAISGGLEQRAPRLYPPPPALLHPDAAQKVDVNNVWDEYPEVAPRLGVLMALDAGGLTNLYSSHYIPLAQLQLASLQLKYVGTDGTPPPIAFRGAVTKNLKHLVTVGRVGAHCSLDVCIMHAFASQQAQLHRMTLLTHQTQFSLRRATVSMDQCSKAWAGAMRSFGQQMMQLESLLRDHGSDTGPREELLRLLACGSLGAAMHQFLSTSMGEAGVRRLARDMDSAASQVWAMLCEGVIQGLELALLLLGDMYGLAVSQAPDSTLGLKVEAVDAVKAATTQLLIRAAALRETCTQVMAEYRLFFSWMLRTVLRLGEDAAAVPEGGAPINVAAVAHFLQGQFHTDTVGQELQEEADGEQNCVPPDPKSLPVELQQLMSIMGLHPITPGSLRRQLRELEEQCMACFSHTVDVLSPTVHLLLHLPINSGSKVVEGTEQAPPLMAMHLTQSITESEGQDDVVLGIREYSTEQSRWYIIILRLIMSQHGSGQCPVRVMASAVHTHDAEVVDMAWYKDSRLALLCQQAAEGAAPPRSWLLLADTLLCKFTEVASDCHNTLQLVLDEGCSASAEDLGASARACPYPTVSAPLAVSGPRGVACVFAGQQRVLVYDLEEHEGSDGDEGDESDQITDESEESGSENLQVQQTDEESSMTIE